MSLQFDDYSGAGNPSSESHAREIYGDMNDQHSMGNQNGNENNAILTKGVSVLPMAGGRRRRRKKTSKRQKRKGTKGGGSCVGGKQRRRKTHRSKK
jgi:hypothetical protein